MTLDLFDGRHERDVGLENVRREWSDSAVVALIRQRRVGNEVTIDTMRETVVLCVGEPHHGNAWGALFQRLVRSGRLEKTGRWAQSARVSNHARECRVYRWIA